MLDQELLQKYIIYAKKFVQPKLSDIDMDKIANFYAKIRQESSVVGGIAIAARHLESVIRMSEASAKIHLRDYVTREDIDFAIDMMLESFLQSQKVTVARQLSHKLQEYKLKTDNSAFSLVYNILKAEVQKEAAKIKAVKGIEEIQKVNVEMPVRTLANIAKEYGLRDYHSFMASKYFTAEFKFENGIIKTSKTL